MIRIGKYSIEWNHYKPFHAFKIWHLWGATAIDFLFIGIFIDPPKEEE